MFALQDNWPRVKDAADLLWAPALYSLGAGQWPVAPFQLPQFLQSQAPMSCYEEQAPTGWTH